MLYFFTNFIDMIPLDDYNCICSHLIQGRYTIMTFIEEAIISGFIGEAISRCTDASWTKIKEAVKNRKNKHQNIESQIYNVFANVLNQLTYNKFENDQDKIYQATERILRGYKDDRCNSIEVLRSGLQILGESVNSDKYAAFREILYQELGKNEYQELYRQIRLFQEDEESSRTLRISHNVNEVKQDIEEIKKVIVTEKKASEEYFLAIHNMKFQNNKKQDYLKNWKSRLFLHIYDEENPLTLADVFIMPDFKIHKSVKTMGFSNEDTLDKLLNKFVKYDKTSTMLITGVPGMGKTSITSWISDRYKYDDNIIVLRFCDWDYEDLEKGILKAICYTLVCQKKDLEDKILVIDGFDEMKALDIRDILLNEFLISLMDFKNFKCIITSRPAYINSNNFQNVLDIQKFDIKRVGEFYKIFKGEKLYDEKRIEQNLEVLGIPVILYMAIMTNIDIDKNFTKPELYNRIFAERGGIFDRFCNEGIAYSEGKQLFRVPQNTIHYMKFLREIAFFMFEKNDLCLYREEYIVPELQFERKHVSILEFPIKNLFENAAANIEFIHKSIFEYFVSEYIFFSIDEAIKCGVSKEDFAGILGDLFLENSLSFEMLEFLEYKVRTKLGSVFNIVNDIFQLMLRDGMTRYTKKCKRNVIESEINIFANMMEILHFCENITLQYDFVINNYLRSNYMTKLNLKGITLVATPKEIDLAGAKLIEVNLERASLVKVILERADLERANLERVNLAYANLEMADLRRANLRKANLYRSHLRGADLCGADLQSAILTNADLRGAYFIGALLDRTNFIKANIEGAKFNVESLDGAIFSEEQMEYLKTEYHLQDLKAYVGEIFELEEFI